MAALHDGRSGRTGWRRLAKALLTGLVLPALACAAPQAQLDGSDVPASRPEVPGCSASYALQSGKRLLLCGKSLLLQEPGSSPPQRRREALVLRLQDDTVLGIREFSLAGQRTALNRKPLETVLLIDTGADICFGTFVVLLGQNGELTRWGTLDEVVDKDGDIGCVSAKAQVSLAGRGLEIHLPPPTLLPRKDGSYAVLKQVSVHVLTTDGELAHKPRRPHKP